MNTFWTFTVTGIIAGWPPAVAGMWLTWKLAKKQVAKEMSRANDAQLLKLTAQTRSQVIAALAKPPSEDDQPPV